MRARVDVELVGSPLTHERFLRRHRGTYGPELSAADSAFPGAYGRERFLTQSTILKLGPQGVREILSEGFHFKEFV